jgi:hypothetical protein
MPCGADMAFITCAIVLVTGLMLLAIPVAITLAASRGERDWEEMKRDGRD